MDKTTQSSKQFEPVILLAVLFIFLLSSCNFPTGANSLPASANSPTNNPTNNPVLETVNALSQTIEPSATVAVISTATQSPTEVPTVVPSDTSLPVTITPNQATVFADKSAANIRRGPGLAYNATGGLPKGVSTAVYGRNSDGSWVYVAIPDQPGKFGWVTSLPQYVTLSVDVMSLELIPYEQPVPAFIQNCTDHTMLLNPGNITLSDRNNTGNKKQFFPNIYLIYDENVNDTSGNFLQIRTVTLVEGQTLQITKDGKGKSYSCP